MASVVLRPKATSLFVGSFTPLNVEIDPSSGLGLDDLVFEVPTGLDGGLVSLARESSFSSTKPVLMLLAGHQPGTHVVQAIVKATAAVVGEVKFRVTGTWRGKTSGPGLWFSGSPKGQLAGSAWGGGPAGPQNIATIPAVGTRRIAILFVDTSSQRYTSDVPTMQGHRDRWMNEVINGVMVGGQLRSARQLFREMSYSNFDLSAQVFGPVSLSGDFDTHFNTDGTPMGSYFQACVTAGDGLIDYTQFDTLVCVSQSTPASGTNPARSAWPYASIGIWGPYTTSEGNRNLGVISMPNEWGLAGDREIHETFSHELGHNLGLGDQYTPAVAGRNAGGWELMHADDPLPHVTVAHRMMLGWIPSAWVRPFDFASSGAPRDEVVTLHPVEQGAPAGGRFAAAEVRIADGLNYYFEYRNGENPHIGDRSLPSDDRVLGTDVASAPFVPPFSRPTVLLLPNDGDDDGPVLGNGNFYREIDASPFPVEFRADVSGIDGAKADVRIRYGANGRPDPSIRPWPASAVRLWQSPDIEVRNARSMADVSWANVPWAGNVNTVAAAVRNGGTVLAPAVRVNFYVKNFNIGGAPEVFLGSDTRDIAPGTTVEFTTTWVPPSTGHFCVVVRIPLYVVPSAPTIVEMTELNNIAQSNYDRFVSATASPATREETFVEVGNPYSEATRVWIIGEQTNPLFRTYLQTTWVWLKPGQRRKIRVMLEYALDPKSDVLPADVRKVPRRALEKLTRLPNDVGLYAYAEDPRDNPRHALELLGGANVQVATGRATRFQRLGNDRNVVIGTVVASDDGQPVSGGMVVITAAVDKAKIRDHLSVSAPLRQGSFTVKLPGDTWKVVKADYLGEVGYAPCAHDWMALR